MNPIFFKIGSIEIYWYSVILFIAFSLGIVIALNEAKKRGIDKEIIYDYALYVIPIALIGARLYYVLFNVNYYSANPWAIFKVWEGGLAIHGGLIAGLIFTYFYTKKKKIYLWKFTDALIFSLIIGQIIGRWGNFMNGEAFGPITSFQTLSSMHIPNFIIDGVFIDGNYHHPTFLYESLWNCIGLFILWVISKQKFYKNGYLVVFYLIWYGIGRFLIESMRLDSLMLGNLKIAQFVSIGMILVGIILFIFLNKKKIDTTK